MENIILVVHVIVAIALVGLILIQHGKGADAGSAFGGGGGSQSLLGSDGTTSLFTKITVGLVVLFFATSLSLAYLNKHGEDQNMLIVPEAATETIEIDAQAAGDVPEVTVNPIEPDGDVPVVEVNVDGDLPTDLPSEDPAK